MNDTETAYYAHPACSA